MSETQAGASGGGPLKKTAWIVVEEGGLEFVTPAGRLLARLEANGEDGAMLSLVGAGGLPGVMVVVGGGSSAVYALEPQTGAAAALKAAAVGASVRVLQDRASKGGVEIADTAEGAAMVVRDPAGGNSAVVGMGSLGGVFNAFHRNGNVAVSMSSTDHGGDVTTLNADGTDAASMGAHAGSGGLIVYDARQAPVFTVPVNKMPGFRRRGKEDPAEKSAATGP